MNKINYMVGMLLIGVMLGSCAPIDGLGGEEDNLPDMQTSQEEDVVPIAPTEEIEPMGTVEEEEVSVIPEIEALEVLYVRIKADALNVRSDASLEAERVTKIYDGQIYEVLQEKEDLAGHTWYQIEAADAIVGWISSDYCVGGQTYNELVIEEE